VEDDSGYEAVAQSIAEPSQVFHRVTSRRRIGLDFDPDDPAAAELSHEIDLMPPLRKPGVI
jgi:hypothetical protein